MKKLMSTMLAMAAMASLISCSTEDVLDEGGQIDNGPVEIRLNAGVSATTKAAIQKDFTEDFTVYFFRPANTASGTDANWTAAGEKIKATVKADKNSDETHPIEFLDNNNQPQKLFYDDNGDDSHLVACHLGTSTEVSDNLASGNISFTITGEQDIMATDGQSANKTTQFQGFQFKHLLTQIDVVLKGDAAAKAAFGNIKSVKIKNVPTQLKLTLAGSPQLEPVASVENSNITVYEDLTNGGEELKPNADDNIIGSTVMIYNGGTGAYGTNENPLKLEVTSEKGGTNGVSEVTINNITDNTGLEVGKKHVITLNFKEKISATATVAEWGTGGAGSGSVE